jgi:hypothetical protein
VGLRVLVGGLRLDELAGREIDVEVALARAISPRTRSRIPLSMGSYQSSKRWELISVVEGESSGVVVTFFMAWSPARRSNAG